MKAIRNLFNNLIAFLLGLSTSGLVFLVVSIFILIDKNRSLEEKYRRSIRWNIHRSRPFSSMMQDQNGEDLEEEESE